MPFQPNVPTEGPDVLYSDPDLANETINALGGNDTIIVRDSNVLGATITVNAGDGDDTISVTNDSGSFTVNANGDNGNDELVATASTDTYIVNVTPVQVVLTGIHQDGAFFNVAAINYAQIERLEISGIGHTLDSNRVYWTTGNTIDKIYVQGTRGELPITVSTGGGNDEISFVGLVGNGSQVVAGDGNDIVRGGSRNDILEGGDGDDNLDGGDGDDILVGGGGWDTITGGNGNDLLIGGAGREVLLGGAGNDTFRYESVQDSSYGAYDTLDWVRGVDTLDLSPIDANPSTPGDDAFIWIGATPFTGRAGELRGTMLGIQADINGDAIADMIIWLNAPYGGLNLTAGDFVL